MTEQIQIDTNHQDILKAIGNRVKELRTKRKIKINEICEATKIHRNSYSQLEHGKTYFKISALMRILDYHKITISEFFKTLK